MATWRTSWWARHLWGVDPWRLEVNEGTITLWVDEASTRVEPSAVRELAVSRGVVWSTVSWPDLATPLRGLPNRQADELAAAIASVVAEHDRIDRLRNAVSMSAATVIPWANMLSAEIDELRQRWIPGDVIDA